ncbi:WW domain-containing protein, putative isoform 4 [Quillaja saponaria]|uniref:WW domain-containing protein, putative isoform 4 n=1 Tax=Quillaja saponaria TaxID=32244 RepID=A0AAD7PQX1_QUISA|nr:WW domain-containing protein, putative isoform 4 [Quillaja saponaria]
MGKRKERRLAAKSNAGRRVKLDLFAEPSGELGGSTVHDDVGEDMDSRHRDGLPNSPSSSGQQPKDSLLLLGQYSDDELDEESSEGLNHAKLESPLQDEEAKCLVDEECKDIDNEVNVDEDPVSQTGEQKGSEQNFVSLVEEGCDNKESYSPSVCGLSDVQGNGDVSLGWKMLNSPVTMTTVSVDKESMENTAVDVNNPDIAPAVHGSLSANTIDSSLGTVISHGEVYGHQSQVDGWDQQYINRHLEGNQSEIDFPSHLVKRSECLLERLKSLDWSKEHVQVQDLLSRYILEVEIRLSDFKSLAFHGSSLLPFWLHSEMQIKRLESLIDDGLDKGDARHDPSCSGNDGPLKSMKRESKADENGLCTEISHDSPYVDISGLGCKGFL